LGKRVMEIVYGDIDPAQKQRLHEQIGAYQETLYREGFLPSASYLTYHYKRSANQEKTRLYEQAQALSNTRVRHADEYARSAELGLDGDKAERFARVSIFVRALQTSVGTVRL